MRTPLFVAAVAAAAMLASPDELRSALATAASALFESTPFLLAGIVLARYVREPIAAYLTCGCSTGPSARSLPAAVAAWVVFGPVVAVARVLAGTAVARFTQDRRHACSGSSAVQHAPPDLLAELATLLPAALMAGAVAQATAWVDISALKPSLQAAGGALLAFVTAPCGIGAVAVAGALHARAPFAAAAFLCVAGIADLRVLAKRRRIAAPAHDALGYAMLCAALGIVGWNKGGALVHPVAAYGLLASAAIAFVLLLRNRCAAHAPVRFAPALMLAGALVAAPPPEYHATETTIDDLFAGERLTFTGRLARSGGSAAVVRFAITCCRADATPVVVRLADAPQAATGSWLRVSGTIVRRAAELLLVPQAVERIAPPTDPFVYR
ncbi:MAG: hypothetical protein JOY69_01430 [Candidatus Eremiobacteraeota bacterium]|nr:hypothetical protein [Candidatus Eremiobacteraeota bacterium]